MDSRELVKAGAIVGVLAAVTWAVSCGGGLKLREQLDLAAGTDNDDDTAVTLGSPINTGMVPPKWAPHLPANAHLGRHRMYRHPKSASARFCAPQQLAYDWRYSPPSEGDL